tara:strand:- start:690 stop:1100 length:411 start_codon:yes stop_codon:yes gene_type:complete
VKTHNIEGKMAINKGGRKRLGNRKREHTIMLRFNETELEKVKAILQSYNLDFRKRGTVGPFLRKLILNRETIKEKRAPDSLSNLNYQLNKIGSNINQLVKVANYKNRLSPNANLDGEMQKANELMLELIETINTKD